MKTSKIEFAVDDMFREQPLDWHQYGFGEHRYHHHQHNSHHHHHHHHHHPVHHNPLPGDRLQQPACVPAAKGEESGSCLHLRARFVDMFLLTLIFIIILPLWICQQQLYDITSLSPSPLSSPYHQHQHQHIFHHDHQPPSPPASLWATASVAGCLLGSILSDLLGRRKALMVLGSIFITAWCLGFLLLSSHTSPQPPGMPVPVLLLLLFLLEAQCHYVLCHSK